MNFYNKIIIVSALVLTSLTTVTTVLSTRAEAQTVKRVQTRQLSIVLKRVNKDSSRVYTVNNQEVIVTKARLDEVAKIVKDNNIKAPVNSDKDLKLGTASALPAWALTGAALVTKILVAADAFRNIVAVRYVTSFCAAGPRICFEIVRGLFNGSRWAMNKARDWANGRR